MSRTLGNGITLNDLQVEIDALLAPLGEHKWCDTPVRTMVVEHDVTEQLVQAKAFAFRDIYREFNEFEPNTLAKSGLGRVWEKLPDYKYPPRGPFQYSFRFFVSNCFRQLRREIRKGSAREKNAPLEKLDSLHAVASMKTDPNASQAADDLTDYETFKVFIDAAEEERNYSNALKYLLVSHPITQLEVAGIFNIAPSTFSDAVRRWLSRVLERLKEMRDE